VAEAGFNRWMVPPAAIAVHMCIGQVYGFSVFNVPLTRLLGITRSLPGQDWGIPEVGWIYSIALFMLGISAAVFGKWVERSGPRKTMVASALCFSVVAFSSRPPGCRGIDSGSSTSATGFSEVWASALAISPRFRP